METFVTTLTGGINIVLALMGIIVGLVLPILLVIGVIAVPIIMYKRYLEMKGDKRYADRASSELRTDIRNIRDVRDRLHSDVAKARKERDEALAENERIMEKVMLMMLKEMNDAMSKEMNDVMPKDKKK